MYVYTGQFFYLTIFIISKCINIFENIFLYNFQSKTKLKKTLIDFEIMSVV